MAPAWARVVRLRRCMRLSGFSRGTITSVWRSLSITSAAREIRSVVAPLAIRPMVPMVQGAIIIISAAFEPDAYGW